MQVLCDKYWPLQRGTVCHGLIQVTTVARKQGPDYFTTTINLRKVSARHIHHPLWHRIKLLLTSVCDSRSHQSIKWLLVCVAERLSNWQDNNTLLLPCLARPGSPKRAVLTMHFYWACAAAFRSYSSPGPGCGALQVWPLTFSPSLSFNVFLLAAWCLSLRFD